MLLLALQRWAQGLVSLRGVALVICVSQKPASLFVCEVHLNVIVVLLFTAVPVGLAPFLPDDVAWIGVLFYIV